LEIVVESGRKVKVAINKLIKSVSEDIDNFKFNTAIAKMMETLNKLEALENNKLELEEIKIMIKLLAPFAPYLTEELWNKLGGEESVHTSEWPEVEKKYLVEEKVKVAVAINGKMREVMEVKSDIVGDQEKVLGLAKELERVKQYTKGRKIIREVFAKGRMVNLVVE